MLQRITNQSHGSVGNNQGIATAVTSISPLDPGRYKVWGNVFHTLANGVRLVATGQSNFIIGNPAAAGVSFGPIIMDLTTGANTVLLELELATGASDVANGDLYVERINL